MRSNPNILLVENSHRDRKTLRDTLENWGYKVTTTFTSQDALEKIKATDFELMIADFGIFGLDGIPLLGKIRMEKKRPEILFISDRASMENAVESMKIGALDFLLKPVEPEQIRLCTEKIFTRNSGRYQHDRHSPPAVSSSPVSIITRNETMKRLLNMVRQVADSMASILIQGESGTGKELFARYIHENSNRCSGPFVAVNCAALPEALLESELFGHEKGAFTGAVSRKPGKFEMADGGSILLDEITEMQLHLQSKLLRVIQEREVDCVGGLRPIPVNVRILATTNRNVRAAVEKGDFREDLFYRLNIIPVRIPALRQRVDDIDCLAHYFVEKYNGIDGRNVKGLTEAALRQLSSMPLKGNVRELENLIRRALLLSDGHRIDVKDLFLEEAFNTDIEKPFVQTSPSPPPYSSPDAVSSSLKEIEKKAIFHTLDQTNGNRTHAAKILGISIRTLRNKLNEYRQSAEVL